jgi:hypothetical protein
MYVGKGCVLVCLPQCSCEHLNGEMTGLEQGPGNNAVEPLRYMLGHLIPSVRLFFGINVNVLCAPSNFPAHPMLVPLPRSAN